MYPARLLAFSLLGLATAAVASTALAERDDAALRQIAGVLDYIAGDYGGAVDEHGHVTHQGEYEEQLSLVADADALASQAGVTPDDALRSQLSAIREALARKEAPAKVAELCRQGRSILIERHGVVLTPTSRPSREEGARLYREQGCPSCHGADGSADTEAARQLDPRPANFLDAERMADVSPHRAYYAISFGVQGTAMAPFGKLRDAERWSLAFYVLGLRHEGEDFAAGKRALGALATPPPSDPPSLALLTDSELETKLSALAEPSRTQALSYLRADAPFAQASGAEDAATFALARKQLRDGLAAYQRGDAATARQLFVSAYLDGFEPHEAALTARDRALVLKIESAMLSIRRDLAGGAAADAIATQVDGIESLLAQAEQSRGEGGTTFAAALTISLREGLEIALLVAALLGLVRRRGSPELAKYVHAGWMLAVPAGLLTWWGAAELLGGLERELAEGIAALLAATVLLGVTHWLFGQLTARQWMGFLSRRMQEASASGKAAASGILALSFIAAYREAFEIVLFYNALLLDAGERTSLVWLGAGAGIAALVLATLVLKRIGQRLQPRPFMLMSSALLALLSFMLVGKGVRALQEAAVLPMTALPLPELPLLGIHATVEGVLVQGAVLCVLAWSAIWPWLKSRRDHSPQPAE